jgi:uncharacterized protein YjbJ (UPF0337 family)
MSLVIHLCGQSIGVVQRDSASNPRPGTALCAHERRLEHREEKDMNWDRVEGNWKQLTGKVKEQWGKLTEDDLTVINGKQDQLVGRIQERYGIAKDEAERQVHGWMNRM